MASSSLAFALCIMLCVCSVQSVVAGAHDGKKPSELVIYVHEFRGGPDGTLLPAAGTGQGNATAVGWGSFLTIDNFITSGPKFESTALGKFTGFAALTTKGGLLAGGTLVLEQLRFGPKSKWNGSSITFTGNLVQEGLPTGPWEVIVLGGTGHFRGITGYATSEPYLATTVAPRFVYKWVFYLKK